MTYILGINAYHGDSSAVLIKDGKLLVAIEEERFRRVKHWAGFPSEAIKFCLKRLNIGIEDIEHIAISRNPLANFDAKLYYLITKVPNLSGLIKDRFKNFVKISSIKDTLFRSLDINSKKIKAKFYFVEHHRAHISSAFYASPFSEAAIFSVDGFGDFVSTMWGVGFADVINVLKRVNFPHSLGILYTAVTQYLGFLNYGDEYKVMGLAAYGRPIYLDKFRKLLKINTSDGRFKLNLCYFLHQRLGTQMSWENTKPTMGRLYSEKFIFEFGPERLPNMPITQRHQDIASSLQAFLEEVETRLLDVLYRKTKLENLCIAGGVGFNSVANGKIVHRTRFKRLFVQPAAGDAGTALGAAFYVHHMILKKGRNYVMDNVYLGTEYMDEEIEEALNEKDVRYKRYDEDILFSVVARLLAEGKIIGWFQGKMEFGPRALGNRSILADPRRQDMRKILNFRIKHREGFRPFAPSVLEEDAKEYFENIDTSPFMLLVFKVKEDKRRLIPAVVHCDGTARVQTVSQKTNPRFWKLLAEFKKITKVPILLNTSFNENEPIVSSPEDAIDCFLNTKMDVLVIGDYIVEK